MDINELIAAIREAVSDTDRDIPEAEVMAALVDESEGWRMRLQELESGG